MTSSQGVIDRARTAESSAVPAAQRDVWIALGATPDEAIELSAYAASRFDTSARPSLPMADELHVAAWSSYAAESAAHGVIPVLRERLVQLRFPIRAGMSGDEAYLSAVRRGDLSRAPASDDGAAFINPSGVRLLIHPTPAGRVPVLIAQERADFVTLVRALTRRNEPVAIPDAMGACIVAGYNNWDRVARARKRWAGNGGDTAALTWPAEFARLRAHPETYQDRFILLSSGPYSATPADALGLREDEWHELSVRIRLEHECAHYFTRRIFGAMQNSLLDELIADYAGIVLAIGRFRADWLLRFMGLETPGVFRGTGRLASYRGDPPLGDGAFHVLQGAVRQAAAVLEEHDAAWHRRVNFSVAGAIRAIARAGLDGLLANRIEIDS